MDRALGVVPHSRSRRIAPASLLTAFAVLRALTWLCVAVIFTAVATLRAVAQPSYDAPPAPAPVAPPVAPVAPAPSAPPPPAAPVSPPPTAAPVAPISPYAPAPNPPGYVPPPAPAPPVAAAPAYDPATVSTTIPPGYEPVDEPGQLPPGYAPVVPPPVQPAPPPPLVGEPPDVGPEEPDQGPHCLFGGLCFGPVLTAGALDVFGIGAHARTEHWGVGIDYQFVRFTAKGIPIRLSLLTIEGRLYPFGGAFFIAGGLAWQDAVLRGHVSYQGDSRVPPIETDAHGEVSVPVFKVGLGFMGRSGFVMGIDLALGLQLGRTRVTFSSDLPRIQPVLDVEESIRQRADTWVRALPFLLQVNLLRFGVLF